MVIKTKEADATNLQLEMKRGVDIMASVCNHVRRSEGEITITARVILFFDFPIW